jgi:hypothetical protein
MAPDPLHWLNALRRLVPSMLFLKRCVCRVLFERVLLQNYWYKTKKISIFDSFPGICTRTI